MKVATLLMVSALAVGYVSATPEAEADPGWGFDKYCRHRGQACVKSKREAEAIAQEDVDKFCNLEGRPCHTVKRAAEAAAIALAEAVPEPGWGFDKYCRHRGQACVKAKREAEADPGWGFDKYCRHRGQACVKAKRGNEALEAKLHEIYAHYGGDEVLPIEKRTVKAKREAEPDPFDKYCKSRGQACVKAKRAAGLAVLRAKRAADALAEALAEPSPSAEADPAWHFDQYCNHGDQACGKARRDLEELSALANATLAEIPETSED